MTSRITYDTNSLRIRDLFVMNKDTNDFISRYAVPITFAGGQVEWVSSIEFLSTIIIPPTNISLLNLLDQIQPGLSSLSTQNGAFFSTQTSSLTGILVSTTALPNIPNFSTPLFSTISGLGSAGYLSTLAIDITSINAENLFLKEDIFKTTNLPLYAGNAVAYSGGSWYAGGQRNASGSESKECFWSAVDPREGWFPIYTNFTKVNTILPFTRNSQSLIAVGGKTLTNTGAVQISVAGGSWRSLNTTLTEVYGLAYGIAADVTPYLIAVGTKDGVTGAVQATSDFSTFTEQVTTLSIGRDIVYDTTSAEFTAVGYSDGTIIGNIIRGYPNNWVNYTTPFNDVYAIATNNNNEYLTLGTNAITSTIYTSPNYAGVWTQGEPLFSNQTGSDFTLRYLSSHYIACGPSSILYNYDSIPGSWTPMSYFFKVAKDIAYDTTRYFVAVGEGYGASNGAPYFSSIIVNSTLNTMINSQFSTTNQTTLTANSNQLQVGSNLLTAGPIFASTTKGLGTAGYLSTLEQEMIFSTITTIRLSTNMTSMQLYFGALAVSSQTLQWSPDFTSTIDGLGTLGFVSGITQSTIAGLDQLGYLTTPPNVFDEFYVSDLRLVNTNPFVIGNVSTTLTASNSTLYADGKPFAFTLNSASTIDALGHFYVSSLSYNTDLVSSVEGLGQRYVSSPALFSSINALGKQGLTSTLDYLSTFNNLRQYGYLSSIVREKTLYESSFPTLAPSFCSTLGTTNPIYITKTTFETDDIWTNYIYNTYVNGIGLTQQKVYFDLYMNLYIKFDVPLVLDTYLQISLPYANTNLNEYAIPAGMDSFYIDKLSFVTSGINSPSGQGLYFTIANSLGVAASYAISMASTNSLYITINNSD